MNLFFTGVFSIRLQPLIGPAEITVYDAAGRCVAETTANGELASIDASSFPTGVYTVSAVSGVSVSTCRVVLTR